MERWWCVRGICRRATRACVVVVGCGGAGRHSKTSDTVCSDLCLCFFVVAMGCLAGSNYLLLGVRLFTFVGFSVGVSSWCVVWTLVLVTATIVGFGPGSQYLCVG